MRSRNEISKHWDLLTIGRGVRVNEETVYQERRETVMLEVLLDIRELLVEFQQDKEQIRVGVINLTKGIEALMIAYFTKEKIT